MSSEDMCHQISGRENPSTIQGCANHNAHALFWPMNPVSVVFLTPLIDALLVTAILPFLSWKGGILAEKHRGLEGLDV